MILNNRKGQQMTKGWQTEGAAEQYMKLVDVVAPGRQDILSVIARLATDFCTGPPLVMDIGCGWGHVSEEILKARPDAIVHMTDYSAEMVALSQDRFRENPRISVYQHDLNVGLGPTEKAYYDAVVSCFALHHVQPANRVGLYRDIRMALKSSGIFINGDLFIGDSPTVNEWEFDNYIRWMAVQLKEQLGQEYGFDELKARQLANYQAMGDMPGTLLEMLSDLKTAGFTYVDCLAKYQNLAVVAAANR